METALQNVASPLLTESIEFVREGVNRWSQLARQFLDAERESMMLREPDKEDVFIHRHGCKFLIKIGREYQAMTADVEFFGRETRVELEGRLGQLEESWLRFQEPGMSDEESGRLARQIFTSTADQEFMDRIGVPK